MLIVYDYAILENDYDCFESMEVIFMLETFENMASRNSLGSKFSFAAVEKNRIHFTSKSDNFFGQRMKRIRP